MNKVLLWLGTQTAEWSLNDFNDSIDYCLENNIDGLIVKIYEITQGEWYSKIGLTNVQKIIEDAGLQFIPYGWFYGTSIATETIKILQYLNRYSIFIADLEEYWNDDNKTKTDFLVKILESTPQTGELWVTTFSDIVEKKMAYLTSSLKPYVKAWIPQAYSEFLVSCLMKEWPHIGNVLPVYGVLDANTRKPLNLNGVLKTTTISIWESIDASNNQAWIDNIVTKMKGPLDMSKWFENKIGVPFGNPNYDSGLGGSHDMTILLHPNTEITALLPGTVVDISEPSWGKQLGIKLDKPWNGITYMSYLHLSAINPSMTMNKHININDTIGWSGGCNNASQYNGTSNPTGQNFLNTSTMSSQPQIGIALMRGPNYGSGAGWEIFPPIDYTLDPSGIIENAIKGITPTPSPEPNENIIKAMQDTWDYTYNQLVSLVGLLNIPIQIPKNAYTTGIAEAWKSLYQTDMLGPPIGNEVQSVDWDGVEIIKQFFAYGYIEYYYHTGTWHAYKSNGVFIK